MMVASGMAGSVGSGRPLFSGARRRRMCGAEYYIVFGLAHDTGSAVTNCTP